MDTLQRVNGGPAPEFAKVLRDLRAACTQAGHTCPPSSLQLLVIRLTREAAVKPAKIDVFMLVSSMSYYGGWQMQGFACGFRIG